MFDAITENRFLKEDNDKLRKALEDIVRHIQVMYGTESPKPTVLAIAEKALGEGER